MRNVKKRLIVYSHMQKNGMQKLTMQAMLTFAAIILKRWPIGHSKVQK
ncbi:hypothetical protein GTW56_16205 [Bacillus sp. EB93]|nr:hypothetical protein [Peribacillus frigoritolerans]